jgi:hypothetical protein
VAAAAAPPAPWVALGTAFSDTEADERGVKVGFFAAGDAFLGAAVFLAAVVAGLALNVLPPPLADTTAVAAAVLARGDLVLTTLPPFLAISSCRRSPCPLAAVALPAARAGVAGASSRAADRVAAVSLERLGEKGAGGGGGGAVAGVVVVAPAHRSCRRCVKADGY